MNFTVMKIVLLAIAIVFSVELELCGNILIPGCQMLYFEAGEVEQRVMFRNPEDNSCDFRMTLFLEDGQAIWSSGLIPPGKVLTTIELERTLERGRYTNAIMKYECFSLEDGTQLNGAQISLTIQVR